MVVGVNEGADLLVGGHLGEDAGGGVGQDDVHPAVPFAERPGQGRHGGIIADIEHLQAGRQPFGLQASGGPLPAPAVARRQVNDPIGAEPAAQSSD